MASYHVLYNASIGIWCPDNGVKSKPYAAGD